MFIQSLKILFNNNFWLKIYRMTYNYENIFWIHQTHVSFVYMFFFVDSLSLSMISFNNMSPNIQRIIFIAENDY